MIRIFILRECKFKYIPDEYKLYYLFYKTTKSYFSSHMNQNDLFMIEGLKSMHS